MQELDKILLPLTRKALTGVFLTKKGISLQMNQRHPQLICMNLENYC